MNSDPRTRSRKNRRPTATLKTTARCVLLLSGLLLAGCSAKHPATSNPPTVAANPQPAKTHKAKPKPTSTANNYPIQIPKEGDFVVHGCTVTKENGNKADCVCRHAMTQLAVENPDKTIIQCR